MIATPPSELRLINRVREARLIAERLDALVSREPILDPVLLFFGVPRVGKTRLLRESQRMAAARGIPTVFIDFDKEGKFDGKPIDDRYTNEKGKIHLAFDIINGLVTAADAPAAHPLKTTDSEEVSAEKLVEYVKWLQGFLKKPVSLLFDTLEEAPEEIFAWLQEKVLTRLLETQQVFIAMAGWSDYRESSVRFVWPVLRQTRSHYLRPFDPEHTQMHLRLLGGAERWLSHKDLIQITGGLPGLNEEVALAEAATEGEAQLLQHITDVIFTRIGKNAKEAEKELLAISVFRQFDTPLLGFIMEELGKTIGGRWLAEYGKMDRRASRDLVKKLRATNLVVQHPDGYGYAIPHDLRIVLDTCQRKNNLEQHFSIHCFAVRWFHGEVAQGDAVSVADEIYHLAGAWRDVQESAGKLIMPSDLSSKEDRLVQLKARLEGGLKHLNDHKREDELREKIKSVLKSDEFKWVLEQGEIDALISYCDVQGE